MVLDVLNQPYIGNTGSFYPIESHSNYFKIINRPPDAHLLDVCLNACSYVAADFFEDCVESCFKLYG